MINTGGPAFPCETIHPCGSHEQVDGLSIRDYFAAKAMLPLMGHSGGYWTEANLAAYANTAYAMADAMLKAREQ
jgi:hypothetical protein